MANFRQAELEGIVLAIVCTVAGATRRAHLAVAVAARPSFTVAGRGGRRAHFIQKRLRSLDGAVISETDRALQGAGAALQVNAWATN